MATSVSRIFRSSIQIFFRSPAQWYGVTYREDKPFVTAEIGKLVAAGEYPQSLFAK